MLTADIEAMYHQVRLDPLDANALKFLWYPDGDLFKEPQEYQMLVHQFGGVWSPSCAIFALRRTALNNADKFDSDVIEAVQKSFYVYDLLISLKDSYEAVQMECQLKKLLQCGGFHLKKWSSNRKEVFDLKNIDLSQDSLHLGRTIEWDITSGLQV